MALAIVTTMLAVSRVAANDGPPKDFDALVKKGDQARIAANWPVALEAYAKALQLRDDPRVAGRVGLVLVAVKEYEAAAGKLFHAIERSVGVNDAERMRFFQAFVLAQKQTCRLDITIVQSGVKLEIDGDTRFAGRREGWAFVKPGKRTVHASLEGFEDETMEIDAPKAGQLSIKIDLHPVKPPEEPAKQPDPEPVPKALEPPSHQDKPAPVDVEDKPLVPTNPSWKNGSFVVGLGAGVVFGATPTAAIGPHAFVAWRSRSWWEVGVDARVAWTFVQDERFPETRFVTWSVGATPCGRLNDRWFGCGLIQLDGMTSEQIPRLALQPAFGLRVGYEFVLREPLRMQVWVDGTAHPAGFAFVGASSAWDGSLLTGGLGARVVYKF